MRGEKRGKKLECLWKRTTTSCRSSILRQIPSRGTLEEPKEYGNPFLLDVWGGEAKKNYSLLEKRLFRFCACDKVLPSEERRAPNSIAWHHHSVPTICNYVLACVCFGLIPFVAYFFLFLKKVSSRIYPSVTPPSSFIFSFLGI